MDKEKFVQKVKMLCLVRGIKPTNACKESGVGGSFLSDIARGQVPSVVKVQKLAAYLGVTTSELLGEETAKDPAPDLEAGQRRELVERFERLTPERRQLYLDLLRDFSGD